MSENNQYENGYMLVFCASFVLYPINKFYRSLHFNSELIS